MSTTPNSNGGPKTPEGKRISSLNALKHGLTARSPQSQEKIAAELDCSFEEVHSRMKEHFKPVDNLDEELVHRIAECLFKIKLCRQMTRKVHAGSFDDDHPSRALQSVQKYDRTVDMQLYRAISTIARKREMDRKS